MCQMPSSLSQQGLRFAASSSCLSMCTAAVGVSQRPEASCWTLQQWADLVEAAMTIVRCLPAALHVPLTKPKHLHSCCRFQEALAARLCLRQHCSLQAAQHSYCGSTRTPTVRADVQPLCCLLPSCHPAPAHAAGLNTSLPPPALMSGDVFNTTQFPYPVSPVTNELHRYFALQQASCGRCCGSAPCY